ncbi:MAG TPA: transposase family protein [Gallicola sp.]|nr:transposase family protein [Gallicola sp.]
MKRNPNITLCELWYKSKLNRGYSRHPSPLYRFLRKIGWYNKFNVKNTSKYFPKPYDTPKEIGLKWQIDVKYVPNQCKSSNLANDIRYYQYTCIDKASRERFIYHYDSHTPNDTVDFIYRCLLYCGYKPTEIQTDNGIEFTWNVEKFKKIKENLTTNRYSILSHFDYKCHYWYV